MKEKILVVDDNRLNVMLLEQILEDEEYEVHTLESGKLVLETSIDIKPDAILLDIMMPDMDGFEVCKLIKENPDTKHIPIIMVTAKSEGEDLKKAFSIGAFDYIKKPIDEMEVVVRLNSALNFSRQQRELEQMAMRDGLTGLYNHRLILELFDKECEKVKRVQKGIAFVMIDIDHFKNVNDTYGHQAGDEVLRGLSNILVDQSRETDLVGRYGGEEFCMVLSDVCEEETEQICERLRNKVEQAYFITQQGKVEITISVGSCFNNSTNQCNCDLMVVNADKALYRAKNLGRNRVESCVHSNNS